MNRDNDNTQRGEARPGSARRRRPLIVYLLLALPFIGLLWPPLYATAEPTLAGIPFFYWYQMIWVFLSAACVGGAYLIEARHGR